LEKIVFAIFQKMMNVINIVIQNMNITVEFNKG